MKKLLFCFSLFIFGSTLSSGQNWLWGRGGANAPLSTFGETWMGTTDDSGNVYCICNNPVKLVKYNGKGIYQWTCATPSFIGSICCDKWGNLYIEGKNSEAVLMKYSPSGKLIWTKSTHSASAASQVNFYTEIYNCICADDSGNIIITGWLHDTVNFGAVQLISTSKECPFIVKYDSGGNARWGSCAHTRAGAPGGIGYSVSCDAQENVYVLGGVRTDTLIFGKDTIAQNIYLVKYDRNGNTIWARGMNCNVYEMSADQAGSTYLIGGFIGNFTLGNYHSYDQAGNYFLIKYNTNGNISWVKYGTPAPTNALAKGNSASVSTDRCGDIFVSAGGNTNDILRDSVIDTVYFGKDTTIVKGSDPVFVMQYDSTGTILCHSFLTTGGDDENGIWADNLGNAFLCGDFVNTPDYSHPPFTVGPDTLIETGFPYEYGFIAKWQSCVNKCDNTATGISQVIPPTENVSVFPNPSNGVFTLAFSHPDLASGETGTQTIEIYNVIGAKVHTERLRSGQSDNTINLSNQPNGIYLYRVITETGNLVGEGKIIVQR